MSSSTPSTTTTTSTPAKPFQTKLVLLGEAAVGKSSVVLRFVSNEFAENKQPTIGAAFLTQKCRLEDKVIKFEIWDTAGQERFHSLAPMYYRNAQASAVIYDVTKAVSRGREWEMKACKQLTVVLIPCIARRAPSKRQSRGSRSSNAKPTPTSSLPS